MNMKTTRGWPGLLLLLPLVAAPLAAPSTTDPSSLTIAGTSTVRSWSCPVPYELSVTPGTGLSGVLAGEAAVETLTLTVDVAAIDCGNGTMNAHLRKALGAEKTPTISYRLSSYDLARAAGGAGVTAHGTLTIAGSTQPITMSVTVKPDGAGALRATGEQQLVMSQFGVKPPSLMMGTMKVGDAVRVSFDVVLDD